MTNGNDRKIIIDSKFSHFDCYAAKRGDGDESKKKWTAFVLFWWWWLMTKQIVLRMTQGIHLTWKLSNWFWRKPYFDDFPLKLYFHEFPFWEMILFFRLATRLDWITIALNSTEFLDVWSLGICVFPGVWMEITYFERIKRALSLPLLRNRGKNHNLKICVDVWTRGAFNACIGLLFGNFRTLHTHSSDKITKNWGNCVWSEIKFD